MFKRLALCCMLLSGLCLMAADFTYDFTQRQPKIHINASGPRNQRSSYQTVDGVSRAMRLKWTQTQWRYIEFAIGDHSAAATMPKFETGTVTVRTYIPAGTSLISINLRLQDAEGWVYQFGHGVQPSDCGWVDFKYNVDATKQLDGCWNNKGGKGPHKPTLPLKISGFACDYSTADTDISENWTAFQKVEFTKTKSESQKETERLKRLRSLPDTKQTPFTYDIANLTKNVKTSVVFAKERKQGCSTKTVDGVKNALVATFDQTVKAPHMEFGIRNERNASFSMPSFNKAIARVRIYLPEKHEATILSFRVIDNQNWVYQLTQNIKDRPAGWQDVDFKLDALTPISGWDSKGSGQKLLAFPLNFQGVAFNFANKDSNGNGNWVAFESLKVIVTQDYSPAKVALFTGHPINVLPPGSEGDAALTVTASPMRDVKGKLTYTVCGWDKAQLAKATVPVAVAAGKKQKISLPAQKLYGVYYVEYTLNDDDPHVDPTSGNTRYAVFKPVGKTDDPGKGFIFGCCVHSSFKSIEAKRAEAETAALVGIKSVRDDLAWGGMQRGPDQPLNFKNIDDEIAVYGSYGIDVMPIFDYNAGEWSVNKNWKPFVDKKTRTGAKLPDYDLWRTFCRKTLEHLKGKVRTVECWNEPELPNFSNYSPEEYAELLKILFEESRKVDPTIKVQTCGYVCWPGVANFFTTPDFMPRSLKAAEGHFDIHSYHAHSMYSHYKKGVLELMKLRKELNVTAPWFSNETALSSTGNGEYNQAISLFEKFLFAWSQGAIGYNWYDIRNDGTDANNPEHNFGLVTNDYCPKMVYVVYNTLATYFTEAQFIQEVNVMKGVDAFAFRAKNGNLLIPLWPIGRVSGVRFTMFFNLTGSAEVVDMFGNRQPLPVDQGSLAYNIGNDPVILVFKDQQKVPGIGTFFSLGKFAPVLTATGSSTDYHTRAKDLAFVQNTKQTLKLDIMNPTDKPQAIDIAVTYPKGITSSVDRLKATIPAGGKHPFELPIYIAPNCKEPHTSTADIVLKGKIGSIWKGSFTITGSLVNVLSDATDQLPMFELDQRYQMVKLASEVAELQHLTWKGPKDLSAKVWLTLDQNDLVLKAIVTDDKHSQKESPLQLFNGDSIQFTIDTGHAPFYEFGIATNSNGGAMTQLYSKPKGAKSPKVQTSVKRNEKDNTTTYVCRIPLSEIGLTQSSARKGFLFNILVNDNDGEGRESYIQLAPGIGESKSSAYSAIIRTK